MQQWNSTNWWFLIASSKTFTFILKKVLLPSSKLWYSANSSSENTENLINWIYIYRGIFQRVMNFTIKNEDIVTQTENWNTNVSSSQPCQVQLGHLKSRFFTSTLLHFLWGWREILVCDDFWFLWCLRYTHLLCVAYIVVKTGWTIVRWLGRTFDTPVPFQCFQVWQVAHLIFRKRHISAVNFEK